MESINGLSSLLEALGALPEKTRSAVNRGIYRGTVAVWKDSVKNAPRSPTQSQKNAARKTKTDTSKRKRPTAHTRAKPGGIERSISMETDPSKMEGRVFVAANSEAGKYAGIIHDKKGMDWNNRGPGTIAKGPRADEKFIERALESNRENIDKVIGDELRKVDL
jgi:hypothetical protein